jgi:hypothetical protein
MSSAAAALIAFSVQAAYGAPARSTQTMRALRCCAERCDHAKTPAAAGHCCGVAGVESELGVSPQTKLSDTGPAMHAVPVELDAVAKLDSAGSDWIGAIPEHRARSVPLFLLTHSFRI